MFWRDRLSEIILSTITALVVWALSFRKTKKELQKSELELVKEAISIWQKTAEDFQKSHKQIVNDIEILRKENRRLNSAVVKLTKALQRFDPDLATEINNEVHNIP